MQDLHVFLRTAGNVGSIFGRAVSLSPSLSGDASPNLTENPEIGHLLGRPTVTVVCILMGPAKSY
jgi:hypothetical protein